VFPGSCFSFTTGQGAENFITCVLMGLKDHGPKRFSSRPSFAGLFRALQGPCGIASISVCCCVLQCVAVCCSVLQCVAVCCSAASPSQEPLWKCSTNLPNHRSHSCASSDSPSDSPSDSLLFRVIVSFSE